MIRFFLTHHGSRRCLALLNGVLHAFKPQAAIKNAVGMIGTIPGSKNIRIGSSRAFVNDNAVFDFETRHLGDFGVRQNANADDHEITGEDSTVTRIDAGDILRGIALKADNRHVGADFDARLSMHTLIKP